MEPGSTVTSVSSSTRRPAGTITCRRRLATAAATAGATSIDTDLLLPRPNCRSTRSARSWSNIRIVIRASGLRPWATIADSRLVMSPSVIASIAWQCCTPADRSVSSLLLSPTTTGILSR